MQALVLCRAKLKSPDCLLTFEILDIFCNLDLPKK
jgi:hypothetical protein